MELEDAARVRVPPAVDELVVVADHVQVAGRPRKQVDQGELGAVQSWNVVDEHVVETPLDEGAVRRSASMSATAK